MTNNAGPVPLHKMDVYGPAGHWSELPEGTTVGTSEQFVHFRIAAAIVRETSKLVSGEIK